MPEVVAVYGAGAIGSLVGARLQEAGANVQLVGREAQVNAIRANGLLVKGLEGSHVVRLPATTILDGSISHGAPFVYSGFVQRMA